jgi:hypothetical protein
VDDNDHGLVVVSEKIPYVFAWRELSGGSAYEAKKQLVALRKGGASKLSGLDHLALGQFALSVERADIAGDEFASAMKRKRSLRKHVEEAWKDYNASRTRDAEKPEELVAGGRTIADGQLAPIPGDVIRSKVYESYLVFGEKVRDVLGKDIELIETDHFLIWTDWRKRDRAELMSLCEAMYRSVCGQFGLDPTYSIFLSKCPVFCFQKRARFRQFAQQFDGHGAKDSVGYTRSIEKNGHVHVAIVRQGDSQFDRDRFAGTLVHEGTHAVIHRLFSSRLIPHWVNEGYAELVAQRVLGARCVAGGNAELLAKQYVRFDWPIGDLLASTAPIGVHQYPTAHSVVAYLEALDAAKFGAFIAALKSEDDIPRALAGAYGGLTLAGLEEGWRAWVRAGDPALRREDQGRSEPRLDGEAADN